ncbi:MAG: type II toxin-antitoxin system prevent-host-death family antitoxin [Isosphaera sp.]|jgi:prevent-host-death family protein|nr:type II toxin-antitoxin system prevent-host-death family antitoxin [Isosphaera sp.]
MHVVNVSQAKAQLTQLMKRVLAGEEVVIARAGEPLIRLTIYQPDLAPREGGQWRGKVRIAADFDAPDPELERLFYEGPLFPEKPS